MQLDYTKWTTVDFLMEPSFQQWVKEGEKEAAPGTWNEILVAHPHLEKYFVEARTILADIREQLPEVSDREGKIRVWNAVHNAMHHSSPARTISFSFKKWQKIAAILLPLCIVATAIWYSSHRPSGMVQETTGAEKQRLVVLPDASQVTLGSNSNIRYSENWEHKKREVWLKGDARFEVTHLNKDTSRLKEEEKFVVYIDDLMAIEVLGTVFNVTHRDGKAIVDLETGSIKIALKNKAEYVLLKPGERLETDKSALVLSKWKHTDNKNGPDSLGKIVELNNTGMPEIIKLVTENFNKKVIVEDDAILEKRMNGVLQLNNEKEVLFIISNILNVDIDDSRPDTLIIKGRITK